MEMDVVMNFAAHGSGVDVGGDGIRYGGFDVPAVAGQAVFPVVTEIADVSDLAAGRDDLHEGTIHAFESDGTTERIDFDVAVLHVREGDRAVEGFDVDVRIGDVADINFCGSTFEADVAVNLFCVQRSGAGMKSYAGVGGGKDFVVDAAGVFVGALQQVRLNLDAVTDDGVIHFNFVGCEYGVYDNDVAGRRFDGYGAIGIVDNDSRLGSDVEAKFLMGFGGECPYRHARHDYTDCCDLNAAPLHIPFDSRWLSLAACGCDK